jgi:hypothetical protein
MNKNIGTFLKVKFSSDSPLSGTIATLHIKNLEAEDEVPKADQDLKDRLECGSTDCLGKLLILLFLNADR